MKIKPIARTLTATALTNPDPSFVSLCGGPANQTPFHAVRSDDSIHADVNLEDDMKIKRSKAASAVVVAQKGHSVMQFAFSKDVFKTAEEVTAWLSDGGYQDYAVVETSKSFEVSDSSGTRFEVGSTEVIKNAVKGVTAYVAKLAGGSDEDQIVDDEPEAEPAVAVVEKTEVQARERTRAAPAADGGSAHIEPEVPAEPEAPAEPVAAERTEEAPAAEAEVQPVASEEGVQIDAELRAKIDAILAAHPVTVQKGVGCYSVTRVVEIVSSLRYLIDDADYTDFDDATVANLKQAAVSALAALASVVSQFSTEMGKVFRTDASVPVARSEEAPAAEEPAVAAEPEVAAPAVLDAASVAKMIADAVAPLTEQLTVARSEASEARARAEQAESDLAARVEADESRSQTRRGADDLDPPAAPSKTEGDTVKRSRASSRILESFGSRHAR